MIRAIVALVVASTGVAHAGHHYTACRQVADVVGYHKCSRFGTWGQPEHDSPGRGFHTELGLAMRTVHLTLDDTAPNGAHVTANAHALAVGEAARIELPMFTFDMLLVRTLTSGHALATMDGGAPTDWGGSANSFAASLIFGRTTHGRIRLGAELALGGELAAFVASGSDKRNEVAGLVVAPIVEPRLRVMMFAGPWLTVALTAGANLAELGEYTFALTLSPHSRAYDGM